LNGLNTSDSEYKGLIENAFQHLENFKQTYTNSAIAHKKKLISSIFPEKIEFDGKKCRTTRINDVLRYMLQIDKELPENKKGQISKNMSLSRVEPKGVESNYFGADLMEMNRFLSLNMQDTNGLGYE
jgi:hypothetical protein